ncbi:MAG: BACON domain-containing carbohydrate-binding protein [Synergistaceae bacterium]|nr:BACON domain-containing carbohydrate-binding protein [Synergistaceae bacterium]
MKKKNICLYLLMTALFVLAAFASGGCNGGGGGEDKTVAVGYIGEISSADMAVMQEAGIQFSAFDSTKAEDYDSVIIADMARLGDAEVQDALVRLYNDDDGSANNIVLLDPSDEAISSLSATLSEDFMITRNVDPDEYAASPEKEVDDLTTVSAYGIKHERDGDVTTLMQIRHKIGFPFKVTSDDVDYGDPDGSVTAEISGDMFEIYSADSSHTNLGSVWPQDINIGDTSIEVSLNGQSRNCVSVTSGDKGELRYSVQTDPDSGIRRVLEYDVPSTEEAKKAAGWMTDAEKAAANDALDAEELRDWLLSQGEDKTEEASGDKEVNILNYAKNYCGSSNEKWDEVPGVSLTVNSYIVSAHHFSDTTNLYGGNDVYIITQKCILNGKSTERKHSYEHGYYTSRVREIVQHWRNYTYPVNGAEVDEFFMWSYFVRSWLPIGEMKSLTLHDIQPQAVNRVTRHSFTHGWHIGGEIKASTEVSSSGEGKDTTGVAINAGYNTSNTESYDTQDFETKLEQLGDINRFQWVYSATRVPERGSPWTTLTHPVELSISTYSPVHTWVWQIQTSARGSYNSRFLLDPIVEVGGVYSRNSGSQSADAIKVGPEKDGKKLYRYTNISLPKPPLFALNKDNAIINKNGNDVQIVIFSQGDWEWETNGLPAWLRLSKSHSDNNNSWTLLLSADANDSGEIRQANITVYRKNGNGKLDKRTITITQSRN